jgi:succinyl-CoA synthetase beta subunit
MNIHEYQAKHLFAEYGLPVPKGTTVFSVDEAILVPDLLNNNRWVVKAQVHAGGRGKAGGVRVVSSKAQLLEVARELLHAQLVTAQTDEKGQPVNALLIEETSDIDRELYLGLVIDRSTQALTFIASTEGGVEIEKVAHNTPEKIITIGLDPLMGIMPYQSRDLATQLSLDSQQSKQLLSILMGLEKLFIEKDLSLVEINPLVVTKRGTLMCLDGKLNVDDNALYRQPLLRNMRDTTQEDTREIIAREWELNYIALDGNIGCMVNGAGLAMATMDLIKLHGGLPANFLDVGGGATAERVREAFKIILSDAHVRGVLVNIFGGIVRCDLIAEGIISAVSEVGIKVPVVVRLEGNHAELAREILSKSGLNIIAAATLSEAAEAVVQASRGSV